ncbi:hypothetical protein QQF64_003023 [Cirrhinus molitorella]|uniref:Calmodulin binding transcription activator 1 n=1 Tax=Cirrhinus molitorella TaxID=172907 RepID=A0ABR3MIV2_9TELE
MAAENKPEGLKKIRNPDRMYRTAVGYTGHVPPKSVSDDTDNNNEHGHLKIYLPKKLLECLPKCSSLPKERHRWNTNELDSYTKCICIALNFVFLARRRSDIQRQTNTLSRD